ncbi:hypothetical protein DHEL01_v210271 [Diaporthe helianthi]|uniref:Altered inheritance of mitochondria protein 9, mitochondrial n=1 Tax=Diaporthe helianthi TaxID=158607 RepID=A0A2P5HM37_DIAHE|nr:hypothetical protein DHEL01_v210271 [Diaporthe helianthi]
MFPGSIRSARKPATLCITGFIRTHHVAFSSSTITSFQYDFGPHEYTSGYWLRADAAQRDARRVKFDFGALCQKAINSSPGAKQVLRGVKVEGNFSRAFILQLDNGSKVVARIPFPVAGPSRLVTNSGVATIEYTKELHDLAFPAYGSIYFDNDFMDTAHRSTFDKFSRVLVDAGISRVPSQTPRGRADFRGSVEANMELLTRGAVVLEALSRDPRIEKVSAPLLLHPDLHKRNIFVDPDNLTKITAVIDWQSTCLDPALFYFQEIPDICSDNTGGFDQQPGSDGGGLSLEETARRDMLAT